MRQRQNKEIRWMFGCLHSSSWLLSEGKKIWSKIWNTNNNDTLSIDSSDERDFGSKKSVWRFKTKRLSMESIKIFMRATSWGRWEGQGASRKKWAGPNVWLDESMMDWTKSRKRNFRDDPKTWFCELRLFMIKVLELYLEYFVKTRVLSEFVFRVARCTYLGLIFFVQFPVCWSASNVFSTLTTLRRLH